MKRLTGEAIQSYKDVLTQPSFPGAQPRNLMDNIRPPNTVSLEKTQSTQSQISGALEFQKSQPNQLENKSKISENDNTKKNNQYHKKNDTEVYRGNRNKLQTTTSQQSTKSNDRLGNDLHSGMIEPSQTPECAFFDDDFKSSNNYYAQ
eukprot:UN26055